MDWPEVVSALSLGVIAVVLTVSAIAWLRWLNELRGIASAFERALASLHQDAEPALKSVRGLAEDAGAIVKTVRSEVDHYSRRSEDVRKRIGGLIEDVEERLQDLETVIDIVQFEVEETALDVAAALRTTRRSASIFGAMRRAFLGRRRR